MSKSTQLLQNYTQKAAWTYILSFSSWWGALIWTVPFSCEITWFLWPSDLMASSPAPTSYGKAGTGLVNSEVGAWWAPFWNARKIWSHFLQLASWFWLVEVIWMTLWSRQWFLIYFSVTVFWFNGHYWVYTCFHQSDYIFQYIKSIQSCR